MPINVVMPGRKTPRPAIVAVVVETEAGPVRYAVTPPVVLDPARSLVIETHGKRAWVSQP